MRHAPRRVFTALVLSVLLGLGIVLAAPVAQAGEISGETPQEQTTFELDALWDLILEWLGLTATSDATTETTTTTTDSTDSTDSTDGFELIPEGFDPLTGGDGSDDGDKTTGLDPDG